MIQIWQVIKSELSNAKLAYGLIFLLSFCVSVSVKAGESEGIALRVVIFMSYMMHVVINPCKPHFQRLPVSLPVPVAALGGVRVFAGVGAILVVLASSGLAASLFYDTPMIIGGAFHWIIPLVIVITSLQWILFDLANRSSRRFEYVWTTCFFIISFALIWGLLDGVLSFLAKGPGMIGAWAAAVTASSFSVLSFRRRRSFVSWEPGARAQRTSRLVRHGRFASLTILSNQMVSNWKAYALSYVAHGTTVWLFVRQADGLNLDSPVWVAKIAGMIIAGMTLGAVVQAFTEGEEPKQFQYLLLPVSASQVAKYRVIRVIPFVMPALLCWFIVIMRESPGQVMYGIHWAFPALLGWICAGEAVVYVMRDRWPRFRFALSNEWSVTIGSLFMPLGASIVAWCLVAMRSLSAPESIAGELGRALLWSPGGAAFVFAVGVVVAMISVRTFERSSSRLV